MTKSSKDIKLGEILTSLGLLTDQMLTEVVQKAEQTGLPLGRALVLFGNISEHQLRLTLELQELMKTKNLPLDVAKQASKLVNNNQITLHQALRKVGWGQTSEKVSEGGTTLGRMLHQAGMITDGQLQEAQRSSYETGLPLGRMLVLLGFITHSDLASALDLQTAIRQGQIDFNRATAIMSAAKASEGRRDAMSTATTLVGGTVKKKHVRIGELLMQAGILTESDIMNALELSFCRKQTMGEILMELGLCTKPVLDTAVKLQEMVGMGEINVNLAADALRQMATSRDFNTDAETLKSVKPRPTGHVRLGDLLQMSGLVDDNDIEKAVGATTDYPELLGKMLVVAGSINEATLLAALRAQFLLRNDLIKTDDCVKAMQYVHKNCVSFDDALEELGIRIPSQARRDVPVP